MTPFVRWAKFNVVGALGMGVQLATLAGFSRLFAGHYLLATGAALEITLLHNFLWHERFTWRDRLDAAPRLRALWRFHVSNGLVSLCGNLLLMRLLVQGAHVPLLVANAVAILCCSMANFALGTRWAFAATHSQASLKERTRPMQTVLLLCLLCFAGLPLQAQNAPAPSPPGSVEPVSNESYLYHLGAFCGAGTSTSASSTKPTLGCGAGATLIPLPVFVEVGVMGPQANRSYLTGYLSIDYNQPLGSSKWKYSPQILLGYSRLFETGHAIDYGVALALPRRPHQQDKTKTLRLELRDYWTFANPNQHNIMLRVGWMIEEAD